MRRTDEGLVPDGDGWFVLNATDARWREDGPFGFYTPFAGDVRFPQVGVSIAVLAPGQPNCMYHREDDQEDFLVLSGECLLIVDGHKRLLRRWDFVHCPPGTDHVFVGSGEEPCALLLIGARSPDAGIVYPRSDVALEHEAGVEEETTSAEQAYSQYPEPTFTPYREGWLPGA
jgi:uncharacterized cupin superfamily protein